MDRKSINYQIIKKSIKQVSIFNDIKIPEEIEEIYIDIGLAADAPNSISWLSQNSKSFVFGFEPVKENCDRVIKKIKDLGFANRFKLFQCAVDNIEKETIKDFYVTCNAEVVGDHGQSSLFKLRDELKDAMWVEKTVPTLCINLKNFLDQINWERFSKIKILKTDTQGNDFNIIKSISSHLNKIEFINCESHTYNQYQRDDDNPYLIHEYLTNNGFIFLTSSIMNPDHIYKRKNI